VGKQKQLTREASKHKNYLHPYPIKVIIKEQDINDLERRFRTNLINSIGGFKSLVLIGTRSKDGSVNLATFSSLFHLGADPALCGIIVRPSKPGRNTLDNILSTSQYTVNHVTAEIYTQAHQCSAKYDEGLNEFQMVRLTEEYHEEIYAPFVKESRIKFACELVQKVNIELNSTTLLIGKIIQVILPDDVLCADGMIDIEKAGTLTCSGLDSYHSTNKIARLSYAKPNTEPVRVDSPLYTATTK
jgi:flavin reductase (DIM6/NTAB) family NADH-FMN oxidoreductase RutF